MGDDFVTYGFPFIDVESGGSINGMIAAVQQVISQLPPDVKVIPGHGPVSTPRRCAGLSRHAEGNPRRGAEGAARRQDAGPDEAGEAADPWKKYSGEFVSENIFLETLYSSLTGAEDRES